MAQNTTSYHFRSSTTRDSREYQRRVASAAARVEGLGLTKAWIARRIRRTRPHVSAVLNGRQRGEGTLQLIEDLLAKVEAGEIVKR